ncbi:MAG: tetratricopeptide repeat protein [Pseudomonadota bacterium]
MNTDAAGQFMGQIEALLAQGKAAQAEMMCQLALERLPGEARLLLLHARLLFQMGRQAPAIARAREAVAHDGGADALAGLGEMLRLAGESTEAQAVLRQALTVSPAHADAAFSLACVLQQGEDLAGAAQLYAQVLAGRPDYLHAHYNLGVLHMAAGEPQRAADSFRAASRLAPAWTDARVRLAEALLATGLSQNALKELIEIFRLCPVNFAMWRPFARSLKGLDWFESALARPAGEVAEELQRAGILHELARFGPAIDAYRRVIAMNASLIEARIALADALMDADRMPEAVEQMQEIMALEMAGMERAAVAGA